MAILVILYVSSIIQLITHVLLIYYLSVLLLIIHYTALYLSENMKISTIYTNCNSYNFNIQLMYK
jgi:hypothetical protein